MGLKEHSEGVTTPGVKDEAGANEGGEVNETLRRAIAARANYLAQDRPNFQFAAKEASRFMSKPEAGVCKRARRLGRYLKDNSRIAFKTSSKNCQIPWLSGRTRISPGVGEPAGASLVRS